MRFCTESSRCPFCVLGPLWGLRGNIDDHLRLIGKRVVDFLSVLIELFSLNVTAEVLRVNICWKSWISLQRGSVDQKFQVEGVAAHQPFFFSKNYAKWSFVWYKNLYRFFFCFVTMHAFDGQTDRQTDGRTAFSSLDRVCIPCSAVKTRLPFTRRRTTREEDIEKNTSFLDLPPAEYVCSPSKCITLLWR